MTADTHEREPLRSDGYYRFWRAFLLLWVRDAKRRLHDRRTLREFLDVSDARLQWIIDHHGSNKLT